VRDRDAVDAAAPFRLALDLFEAGEAEIEAHIVAWLHERPGAEHGDAVGRPGTWPRR
jgi:hypothetical protein